jgi:hypothetical protein
MLFCNPPRQWRINTCVITPPLKKGKIKTLSRYIAGKTMFLNELFERVIDQANFYSQEPFTVGEDKTMAKISAAFTAAQLLIQKDDFFTEEGFKLFLNNFFEAYLMSVTIGDVLLKRTFRPHVELALAAVVNEYNRRKDWLSFDDMLLLYGASRTKK